ncbi:MAG: GntR family transcriptional regulator [Pseudomonadota bacterium]
MLERVVGQKSQAKRALSVLREMVVTNQLPPGSTHLEVELAEMLGMSRTPVREAAIILESHGLVEMRPRRGMRVLPINPTDMREIYEVLTALEPLAAASLATRGLTAEEDAAFEGDLSDMDDALAGEEDRNAWAVADEAFHRRLVTAAGNSRVITFTRHVADQVQRARMLTLRLRPAPHDSNADHRALVDAIRARDPLRAEELHRTHRRVSGERLIALIEAHGLGPV